jgi:hypothetical protein
MQAVLAASAAQQSSSAAAPTPATSHTTRKECRGHPLPSKMRQQQVNLGLGPWGFEKPVSVQCVVFIHRLMHKTAVGLDATQCLVFFVSANADIHYC